MPNKQQMIYDASKKSVLIAYLLYMFFGFYFQFHRFYAGNKLVAFILLILPVVGFVSNDLSFIMICIGLWVLVGFIDIFYIPIMVKKRNLEIIESL